MIALTACTIYTTSSSDDDSDPDASSGAPAPSTSGGPDASASSSSGSSASSSGSSGTTSSSSTSSSASSTSGGPLDDFEQDLLDGFNAARAAAQPTPQPALSVLYWDYEAASTCQTFTNQCNDDAPSGVAYGGGTSPFDAEEVVTFMLQEKSLYDYASNQCNGGSYDCVFYKMIVLRTVNRVGCARTTCGGQDRWACKFTVVGNLANQPY